MEQTAPSKKGTALAAGITAIVSIAAKDNLSTQHLICIGVIATMVMTYFGLQAWIERKKIAPTPRREGAGNEG